MIFYFIRKFLKKTKKRREEGKKLKKRRKKRSKRRRKGKGRYTLLLLQEEVKEDERIKGVKVKILKREVNFKRFFILFSFLFFISVSTVKRSVFLCLP